MINNAKSHINGSNANVFPNVYFLTNIVSIKVKIRNDKNNLLVDRYLDIFFLVFFKNVTTLFFKVIPSYATNYTIFSIIVTIM